MGDTAISWTDKTWNPVRGCSPVSPGCAHCYAEQQAGRIVRMGKGAPTPYDGLVHQVGKAQRWQWTGSVRLVPEHLADPLRWRKPVRVFVNSMSDLFHESLSNEQIAAVFGVMAGSPQHTFQVLTKRAERMRDWFRWLSSELIDEHGGTHDISDTLATYAADEIGDGSAGDQEEWFERIRGLIQASAPVPAGDVCWPLPNVWLGVSVEDQERVARVRHLRAAPAAVRFLSCEPLLGGLDLVDELMGYQDDDVTGGRHVRLPYVTPYGTQEKKIHWVIAGCESGPGARPCDVEWLRSLRDQCARAGVAFWLKQAVIDGERCDVCDKVIRYRALGRSDADASCDCTIEGAEPCEPVGVMEGEGSKLKSRRVIELPYLDGVQHAVFPVSR